MSRATHVMVVDDDEDFRAVLGELLESEGCTVYTADNGRQALDLLRVLRPDLMLVDLMMPVMNGWDLCVAIENDPRLADIPLVILSGVARFSPQGRARVLTKPFALDTVVGLLDAIDAPSGVATP